MEKKLGNVVFTREEKIGHGSPPGSDILSYSFPYISKFGHSFRPKSVWKDLGAVDLSWEEKSGHGSPFGSGILPYIFPYTSQFRHMFCPESVGEELGLWFCLGTGIFSWLTP